MNRNKKNGRIAGYFAKVEKKETYSSVLSFLKSNFLICYLTASVISCAGTQRLILQDNQNNIAQMFVDTMETVKGFGDITFSFHGERYRGKIAVSMKEWTHFSCEFYTPFAQTIASISSDDDSAYITIEDREYRISVFDEISTVPFFTQYPFIFNDLIRILTGRIIHNDIFSSQPSKKELKNRQTVYSWKTDSITVTLNSSRNGKKLRKVSFSTKKGIPWRIEYSSIRDGFCKEIYFESEGKNYFSLEFDKIEM